jgi:hypothetical protein
MSLGDKLRLLRAERGGVTPAEIEAALPDLPKGLYRYMEQRYRAVGDDRTIQMLADYFGVPFADLRWRLEWPRKGLNRALFYAETEGHPITLELSTGEKVTGKVAWWDLGAVEIQTATGGVVAQRHAVEKWDPPAPEAAQESEEDDEM